MNRDAARMLLAAAAVLALTGCNLQLKPSTGDQTVDMLAQTALKKSAVAKTQDAERTSGAAPRPTGTATLPPTVTLTPTITLTNTLERVTITVSKNTNCREGPDKFFDLVGVMKAGETAEAIGRNAEKTYWVIKLPSDTAKTCWLWSEWATVTGPGDLLPIIQSPPTPTWSPKPDFSMMYTGKVACGGQWAITVQITNTGNVNLESVRLKIYDNATTSWTAHQRDYFRSYNDCNMGLYAEFIQPGTSGAVSNVNPGQWLYDPAGHLLNVYVRVCTQNGLTGTCMDGDFSVTPT